MANGRTMKNRDEVGLTAEESERIFLSLKRTAGFMNKSSRDLKIIKWMLVVGIVVMLSLLIYYLYSVFGILGYW